MRIRQVDPRDLHLVFAESERSETRRLDSLVTRRGRARPRWRIQTVGSAVHNDQRVFVHRRIRSRSSHERPGAARRARSLRAPFFRSVAGPYRQQHVLTERTFVAIYIERPDRVATRARRRILIRRGLIVAIRIKTARILEIGARRQIVDRNPQGVGRRSDDDWRWWLRWWRRRAGTRNSHGCRAEQNPCCPQATLRALRLVASPL